MGQWKLYGWDQNNRKVLLARGDTLQQVLEPMGSQTQIDAWKSHGFVAWELKNEWGDRHVSSGR